MARLFPFRSEPAETEGQPRIVGLEGEDADAVFSALSSTTARRIYARLDEEPATPSDAAEAIDSSIQNVRYHLENLEEAGLVEVVDTWYSSRGNEMSVYATTDGPLIVTSDESTASRLREALSRFVGGVALLAAGGLFVQYSLTRWAESVTESAPAETAPTGAAGDEGDGTSGDGTDAGGDGGTGSAEEQSDDVGITSDEPSGDGASSLDDNGTTENATGNETVDGATDGAADVADAIFDVAPPGLLFFLGGLLVLLAVTAYWYWYRPAY
ncbi:putative transcriptional regulator, ArsR family [Haloterrigena turkmenica DSM 5511]|uniref:Transcriptional regulator, ArsR family n=1 Tax=Haloterrigena turkmenica (strain ATCC 51198 / DSM 5511 / JCM 9101 / NCIMB 13204 / VKM B-1734 / 4k) TaxID=543526 RepID=D2RZT2_HALTV|nr:helix-turn-helix domain-containing protein [Haloterrigena turkmenica]ADB62121.1 putative transcriptional regulator, ArsR family [Haloterrigena turkmenica DSM 5511]